MFSSILIAVLAATPLASAQAPVLSSRRAGLVTNSSSIWPWQVYQTEPDFHPPQLQIDWSGEPLEPSLILLEPRNFNGSNATKQAGPLLLTSDGELMWNGPLLDPSSDTQINNFRVQTLNGTEYLTYWTGYNQANVNTSHGYGNITFLDKHYQTQFVVCPQLGLNVVDDIPHHCEADYQEQYVTPQGTLLITAYNVTAADLSSVGGPVDGYILDSQIHEIDIATSESIWKWSSLDHIALNASQLPLSVNSAATPWDFVHIDSVSPYGEHLLVSGRHTWEVYAINRTSGDIMWTFNGETGGDWGIVPEEASFRWQYHTRVRNVSDTNVIFSMFVNHNYAGANATTGCAPTVGREYDLVLPPTHDISPLTLRTLNESGSLWSDSQGSMDYLPDNAGDHATSRFLGYGQLPLLREFGVDQAPNTTSLKWEARFGDDNQVSSYRSGKAVWHGEPKTSPKLAVLQNGTAFMSWNGATDISAWEIYRGQSNETELIGVAHYRGFETAVDLDPGCYEVLAVLNNGTSPRSANVCS